MFDEQFMKDIRVHRLKLHPKYVLPVLDGSKRFEFRFNDRDYRVGDLVTFYQFPEDSVSHDSSLERCVFQITYVLDDFEYLPEDWCVFGFRRLLFDGGL